MNIFYNIQDLFAAGAAAHPFGIVFFLILLAIPGSFAVGLIFVALRALRKDARDRRVRKRIAARRLEELMEQNTKLSENLGKSIDNARRVNPPPRKP